MKKCVGNYFKMKKRRSKMKEYIGNPFEIRECIGNRSKIKECIGNLFQNAEMYWILFQNEGMYWNFSRMKECIRNSSE